MAARPALPRSRSRRRTIGIVALVQADEAIVCLLIAATLLFGYGCAKQDWIERTLVTVDVTGTWYGSVAGEGGFARDLIFEFEQTGSRVTDSMRYNTTTGTTASSNAGARTGPIAGTVTGDVFRFRQTDGGVEGELSVSGDEMIGLESFVGNRTFSMRRIDSTPRPSAPPR